ncbi:MAG: superoxide dismutase family protein [Bradymonadaceae bacterium]
MVEEQIKELIDGEEEEAPEERHARAPMFDSQGNHLGDLNLHQTQDGLRIHGTLQGLPETTRGFHVHEHGVCEAPSFESAGGHFNPHDRPHGGPDDDHTERHVGDFGNITVGEDGTVEIDFTDQLATLYDGENQIVGQSLVIHEQEDDLETQPTGDAGARIACGIVEWTEEPADQEPSGMKGHGH